LLSVRSAALALALLAPAALAMEEEGVALMQQLEARLVAAKRVRIEASIEARGAFAANLAGHAEWRDRNHAELAWAGQFAGQPVELKLRSDGRVLTLARNAEQHRQRAPAETNRAMLVGMMRMGVLHNLARLSELKLPDHATGGVAQWVQLDSFRPATYAQGGDLEGFMSFGYDLVIDGTPTASVRLWVDPQTQLPRRRQVTVRFPQGDLSVLEDYARFEVE
jgi:hypothetical protein